MAQHDMKIADGSGAVVRSDLNGALEALTTCQLGASAPSPTWPLMWWGDSANNILKQRNKANTAWISHGPLESALLRAADIAAGGSAGLLRADGDGSSLTGIEALDQVARDAAIVAIVEGSIGAGIHGPTVNYDFSTDSLPTKTGATYDAALDGYSSSVESVTGTFVESQTTTENIASTFPYFGIKYTAGSTGKVSRVKIQVTSVSTSDTAVFRLYSDNAGSPGSQIGSDSAAVAVSSTGAKTFQFSADDALITSGTDYWLVFVPQTPGSISIGISACALQAGYGSGRAATIGGISDGSNTSFEYRIEITESSFGNMILIPAAITLDTASPTDAQVYVPVLEGVSADAATNVLCAVTIDGSTYATAEVAAKVYSFGDYKLLRFDVATTGVGSSFIPKITTQGSDDLTVFAPVAVPLYL